MAEKIKVAFIFEMLGRPPEHIKETMSQLIDKFGQWPGIRVDKKIVHEPKLIEDENAKDLFTTFSEVEVAGDDLGSIMNIVFNALPSHIEILEPEELKIRNFDISTLLSELTVKLHKYDEIAKALVMERNMLIGKLKELKPDIKKEDFFKKEEKSPEENQEKNPGPEQKSEKKVKKKKKR